MTHGRRRNRLQVTNNIGELPIAGPWRRSKKQRKKAKKAAKAEAKVLMVDAGTAVRLRAAAAMLSKATGREVTAEVLLTAGAEAVLTICDAAAPVRRKKKR